MFRENLKREILGVWDKTECKFVSVDDYVDMLQELVKECVYDNISEAHIKNTHLIELDKYFYEEVMLSTLVDNLMIDTSLEFEVNYDELIESKKLKLANMTIELELHCFDSDGLRYTTSSIKKIY